MLGTTYVPTNTSISLDQQYLFSLRSDTTQYYIAPCIVVFVDNRHAVNAQMCVMIYLMSASSWLTLIPRTFIIHTAIRKSSRPTCSHINNHSNCHNSHVYVQLFLAPSAITMCVCVSAHSRTMIDTYPDCVFGNHTSH